jgi:hypothetical protein
MKKFFALVLALSMLACAAGALATDSKEDLRDAVIISGQGTVTIIWTTDTVGEDASASETREKIRTAAKNASPLDELPEDLRAQLPEGFTVVNELESVKLEGDLTGLEELTVAFKFNTPYEPESVVYLAAAIPGEETEWVLLEAKADEEGSVVVTFDAEFLAKVGNSDFVLMTISEK